MITRLLMTSQPNTFFVFINGKKGVQKVFLGWQILSSTCKIQQQIRNLRETQLIIQLGNCNFHTRVVRSKDEYTYIYIEFHLRVVWGRRKQLKGKGLEKDNWERENNNKFGGNDIFHFHIGPSMINQNCSHVKYMKISSTLRRLSKHQM